MFNRSDDFSFLDNELIFSSSEDELEDDQLFFAPEDQPTEEELGEDWTIMIVDDDDVIHNVTRLALGEFFFEGKGLNFISAYSGQEAKELIKQHPDTALILLDVVMEKDEAGLEVVKHIRESLHNRLVRIVLRTGQPGLAPEETVIVNYDINDYKSKTELTTQKLFSTVATALRAFDHLITIENHRQELERIANAAARFVPPQILQLLGKESITEIRLGDQVQQEMTVLFCDIRSFTSMCEQMTPQETFLFVNEYLSRVSPIIRQSNGFIDKYMGDGIMAIFPQCADDALQAALAMQREVTLYNQERQWRTGIHGEAIRVGIGLHQGNVMLGTVGEQERMEGTVISDAVNLAARLEGLTKTYNAPIIFSTETLLALEEPTQYYFRYLGQAEVKGKKKPVPIFEVLDKEDSTVMTLRYQHRVEPEIGVMNCYQQAFHVAKTYFETILTRNPHDEAAASCLERAKQALSGPHLQPLSQ